MPDQPYQFFSPGRSTLAGVLSAAQSTVQGAAFEGQAKIEAGRSIAQSIMTGAQIAAQSAEQRRADDLKMQRDAIQGEILGALTSDAAFVDVPYTLIHDSDEGRNMLRPGESDEQARVRLVQERIQGGQTPQEAADWVSARFQQRTGKAIKPGVISKGLRRYMEAGGKPSDITSALQAIGYSGIVADGQAPRSFASADWKALAADMTPGERMVSGVRTADEMTRDSDQRIRNLLTTRIEAPTPMGSVPVSVPLGMKTINMAALVPEAVPSIRDEARKGTISEDTASAAVQALMEPKSVQIVGAEKLNVIIQEMMAHSRGSAAPRNYEDAKKELASRPVPVFGTIDEVQDWARQKARVIRGAIEPLQGMPSQAAITPTKTIVTTESDRILEKVRSGSAILSGVSTAALKTVNFDGMFGGRTLRLSAKESGIGFSGPLDAMRQASSEQAGIVDNQLLRDEVIIRSVLGENAALTQDDVVRIKTELVNRGAWDEVSNYVMSFGRPKNQPAKQSEQPALIDPYQAMRARLSQQRAGQ